MSEKEKKDEASGSQQPSRRASQESNLVPPPQILRVESDEHGTFDVTVVEGKPPEEGEVTEESDPEEYEALQPKLEDETLDHYKRLRDTCGINKVPVDAAISKIRKSAKEGKLNEELFVQQIESLLMEHDVKPLPTKKDLIEVFKIFDKDGNGKVDMMEMASGFALFAKGDENDRLKAVFQCFDLENNGVISSDEMFRFLLSVYKVVLTPKVLEEMKKMNVELTSDNPAEELAEVTTQECFRVADLSKNGQLSFEEFKLWFQTPKMDANFQNSPLRGLLENE